MRACICIYASGVLYLQAAPRSYACMQHHGPILACSTTVLYLHAAPQYCLRVVVHTHPCMHAHMDYAITWFLVPAHTHTQRAHICARALTTSQQCARNVHHVTAMCTAHVHARSPRHSIHTHTACAHMCTRAHHVTAMWSMPLSAKRRERQCAWPMARAWNALAAQCSSPRICAPTRRGTWSGGDLQGGRVLARGGGHV